MKLKSMPLILWCLSLGLTGVVGQESSDETESVRRSIEGYVAAINRLDASTAARFWSPLGEWETAQGERIRGNDKIELELMRAFAQDPTQRMVLKDLRIRFVADNIALEDGTVVVSRKGAPPTETNYVAVHIKSNDRWLIDSVRETRPPTNSTQYDNLKELGWLVGKWVHTTEKASVESEWAWTSDRNFLSRQFRFKMGNETAHQGTEVVGWDVKRKQIRSWFFDSKGGFGQGIWSREGNRWKIELNYQTADGKTGKSTEEISYESMDQYQYRSTGRTLDREKLPDIDPLAVKKVAEK